MSVDQKEIIDFISTTSNGKVVLTISDHHLWSGTWHLQLIQDKINFYLHFIDSGQILDYDPDAAGRELIIEIVLKFEPSEEGISFFEKAKEVIANAGIGFRWRILQTDK